MLKGLTTAIPGLAVLALAQAALSQEPGTVTVDVGQCLALESEDARRDCFAAQVDNVLEDRDTAGPGTNAEAGEVREAADAADASPQKSAPDQEEFFGTITSLQERLPNAYVITLDNGQVWQQVQPQMYPLRPGLKVRIYSTDWGEDYRLSGEGLGRFIQVRRVR